MSNVANACKRCHRIWGDDRVEDLCERCRRLDELLINQDEVIVLGGMDFGRYHDYSALVGIKISKGSADVIGVKKWPHVDYSIVVRETAEIYEKQGMRMLAIDASDAMVEPIQTMLYHKGVLVSDIKFGEYVDWTNPYGMKEHTGIKHAMVEYARAMMQEKKIKLPRQGLSPTSDELLLQLLEQEIIKGADPSRHPSSRVVYGHPTNSHDDLAWSFLMALYVSRPWLSGSGLFGMVVNSTRKEYRDLFGAV
jgi:hypothetical protein